MTLRFENIDAHLYTNIMCIYIYIHTYIYIYRSFVYNCSQGHLIHAFSHMHLHIASLPHNRESVLSEFVDIE